MTDPTGNQPCKCGGQARDCATAKCAKPCKSDKSPSADQLIAVYDSIARGVSHEAAVTAHRINWALSLSGALLAAVTILITIIMIGHPSRLVTWFLLLTLTFLCCLGALFSMTTRTGVQAAQYQFRHLRDKYFKFEKHFKRLGLVRPFGDPRDHRSGNRTARVFPVVLLIGWLFAMLMSLIFLILLTGAMNADRVLEAFPDAKAEESAGPRPEEALRGPKNNPGANSPGVMS